MSKKIFSKEVVILLLLMVLFKLSIVTYIVHGESMTPSLANGEFGMGIRTSLCEINRFDIVIIDVPDYDNKLLIKRVIGLPGETVKYENNILFINDEAIYDEYNFGTTQNFDQVTLGKDEYFCLGDNRNNSSDSRIFGAFKIKNIKAISLDIFKKN